MDLGLFGKAVVRHKGAVLFGVLAAVLLAFLSYVRVDPFGDPKLEYRSEQLWSSKITLQIQEPGFIEGQTVDPARQSVLAQLAPLYAQLANSNAVRAKMRKSGPIPGRVSITTVVDDNRASLPFIRISSITAQAGRAVERATRQAAAFKAFIGQRQKAEGIPPRNRVGLSVVSGPTDPEVVLPRKKTLPIVVFAVMILLTAALVLVLENLALGRARARGQTPVGETLPTGSHPARPEPVPDRPVRVSSAGRTPRRVRSADNGEGSDTPVPRGGEVATPVRPAEWRQGARSRQAHRDHE